MKIEVAESATVEQVIKIALKAHLDSTMTAPKLYHDHPDCYELQFHEDDGFPDDEMPPMQRTRKLKSFADDQNEFCLCELAGKIPPTADSIASSEAAHSGHKDQKYTSIKV